MRIGQLFPCHGHGRALAETPISLVFTCHVLGISGFVLCSCEGLNDFLKFFNK